MALSEPFTIVNEGQERDSGEPSHQLFPAVLDLTSGKIANPNLQIVTSLRASYPDLIITTVPFYNVNFLRFAGAGYARAELETEDDPIIRLRGVAQPPVRGGQLSLAEVRVFAKYRYFWNDESFILYTVTVGLVTYQYILKEPRGGETTLSNSAVTDALLITIAKWEVSDENIMYVFDNGFWSASKTMWKEVQKASWDKVILDAKMKKELTDVGKRFFDSKDVYDDYDVPWKRGLIFHGPAGNGKTISIKALMHTLYSQSPKIPSLYVKSAPSTYTIGRVFQFARQMTPCLLVLEDIDTIVNSKTRSYFFNEVDGLQNNNGLMMIATTNHLDRLDPGLSKRPSRFDRKYLFPLPDLEERTLYCEYWHDRLKNKPNICFPKKLCRPIARTMDEFSFAYMQEAFVATLLVFARGDESGEDLTVSHDGGDGDFERYEFYRVMKQQVKVLRDDMDTSPESTKAPISPNEDSVLASGHAYVPIRHQITSRASTLQPGGRTNAEQQGLDVWDGNWGFSEFSGLEPDALNMRGTTGCTQGLLRLRNGVWESDNV